MFLSVVSWMRAGPMDLYLLLLWRHFHEGKNSFSYAPGTKTSIGLIMGVTLLNATKKSPFCAFPCPTTDSRMLTALVCHVCFVVSATWGVVPQAGGTHIQLWLFIGNEVRGKAEQLGAHTALDLFQILPFISAMKICAGLRFSICGMGLRVVLTFYSYCKG